VKEKGGKKGNRNEEKTKKIKQINIWRCCIKRWFPDKMEVPPLIAYFCSPDVI